MENDILDALLDIGYKGPLNEEVALSKALDGGAKSPEYTKLVHILCDELRTICRLEEAVNMTQDAEEASCFLLELSSFLKELGCPYTNMISGHVSGRLQTRTDRILLLDYLLSELMAARMVNINHPDKNKEELEVVMQESPTARDLKNILIALKFNKPPPNITAEILFNKLYAKLKETIDKDGIEVIGKPLYNKSLTEKQWKELDAAFREMLEEYRLRRETLITRLDCTIQSFEWSDKAKALKDAIQAVYRPKRSLLKPKPDVALSDFLAARDFLLHVEKTSSATVRKNTQSEVNKVIIGRVPDRGGRPSEQQPPPPEMPSWQGRAQGGAPGGGRGGGGGGRGGGGGGRGGGGAQRGGGGRVQGGWSQGDGNRSQGQNRPQSAQLQSNNSYQQQQNQNYRNQDQNAAYQKQGSYSNQNNYQTSSSPYGGAHSYGYERSTQQGYSTQGGYAGSQQGGYSTQQGGYTTQQGGYSTQQGGYSTQQGGYNNQQGGYGNQQGRGGYQNEHDNRTSHDYYRGQSGQRGRSNYNRGGRN